MKFKFPFSRNTASQFLHLRALRLFSDLTLPELAIADAVLHSRDYRAGDVIFDAGDPGRALYILLEGEVVIGRPGSSDDGDRIRLGGGEFFGELGLFDDAVRSTQACAAGDCRLLLLSRDDFNGLMDHHRHVGHKINRQLLRHLGMRLRELGSAVGLHRQP